MTEKPEYTLVYLGKVNRYSREEQLADCRKFVKDNGFPSVGRSVYEHNEIDQFVKDMRGNELALIPRLEGLADIKGSGVGIRFLLNVMKVSDASRLVIDLDTGIRSDAGDDWYQLVEVVASKIMRGRPLGKEQAKLMAKIRFSEPGLEESWKRKKGTPEYKAVASIWGNLSIKPAEKAIGMFPDEELAKTSKSSIQRIFGTRQECLKWLNDQ